MTATWLDSFPALKKLDPSVRNELAAAAVVEIDAGAQVFAPGAECGSYLLVVEGTVRVQMVAESGREIVLYRVDGGETCVLTTACLLSHHVYPAEGVTETAVRAVTLSHHVFRRLLDVSTDFREFVLSAYGERIAGLMVLVEEVAFRRVDLRLAEFLLTKAVDAELAMTHQELAVELGTAREVVSRQLKEFKRRDWVEVGRNRIRVGNRTALADFLNRREL